MRGSGLKLLIVGESGRGKTRLTETLALLLSAVAESSNIAILDFAPNVMGVGAPLRPPPGARYVRPSGIRAPRLESRGDCRLAWKLALHNASLTSRALLQYIHSPLPVLVINDASIHLHAGDPRLMIVAIRVSRVAVVNAYLGSKISDACGISSRERWAVSMLEGLVDEVWRL